VFYGVLNYLPASLVPIADIVEGGIAAAFPIEGISDQYKNTKEDAITGSLTLRYDWTENTTVYAAYNRGYRPSGISINPTPAVALLPNGEADVLHDEESSNALEVGFKGRYLDGRAALNGAFYYQMFDGYFGFVRGIQVLDDAGNPNAISGGLIYNGDANIWGIELEGQILLGDRWSAGGALAYAKGEWDSGAQAPCNDRAPGEVLGFCDIGGESLGGEPELSVSLQSEYFIPAGSNEWYMRGLYKYTDERDNTDASAGLGITRGTLDDYHMVNVYAGLRHGGRQWDIGLWVKNLLDSDEVIYEQGPDAYDITTTGGSYTQTNILAERVLGLTVSYNF
jgi:outer membrane receptor protein involved in Fe transport